jgi:hypothetical protein
MTTIFNIKLPCPSCGGKGRTVSEQTAEDIVETWAECSGCGKKTDAYEDFRSSRDHHEWAANEFAGGRFLAQPAETDRSTFLGTS